jgi:hypothetical protein
MDRFSYRLRMIAFIKEHVVELTAMVPDVVSQDWPEEEAFKWATEYLPVTASILVPPHTFGYC